MPQLEWKHKNILESFLAAFRGIFDVLRIEKNARVILLLGIAAIICGWLLKLSLSELALLTIAVGGAFFAEVFNGVIEVILDIIKPHEDPHVKVLKEITAAAVLIICLSVLIICILLFWPKIRLLLR